MKKITFALATILLAFATNAQVKTIVASDPQNDAGMAGSVDIKSVSYEMSADKKDITFRIETHNSVISYGNSNWVTSGYMIHIDDDLNTTNGKKTYKGNNSSIMVDHTLTLLWNPVNGGFSLAMTNTDDPAKKGMKTDGLLTFDQPDGYHVSFTMPMSIVDFTGDGKFNVIFTSLTLVKGVTGYQTDDAPDASYVKMDVGAPTSVYNINTNDVVVNTYPNPATGRVTFTATKAVNGNIRVFDLAGRTVMNTLINGTSATMPVNELQNGIYMFRVSDKGGAVVNVGKFNVQH